jgi:hypothetical protein
MDPVKVTGFAAWPAPKNPQLHTNFYWRFIRVFSDVTQPLFDLTKKGVPWTWTAAVVAAFQALKNAVTAEPVLVLPDKPWLYRLEVGTGRKWCPVAFYSRV